MRAPCGHLQEIQAIKAKAADALVKALGMEDCHGTCKDHVCVHVCGTKTSTRKEQVQKEAASIHRRTWLNWSPLQCVFCGVEPLLAHSTSSSRVGSHSSELLMRQIPERCLPKRHARSSPGWQLAGAGTRGPEPEAV